MTPATTRSGSISARAWTAAIRSTCGSPRPTAGRSASLQRYRYADNPDYLADLEAIVAMPPGAASIDYFIGEAAWLRRGWGTAMIEAGVAELWQADPAATAVVVPVGAGNVASGRTLERAGFRRVAAGLLAPDNPIDGPEHFIYRIDRPVL